jgi:transposase-like protein
VLCRREGIHTTVYYRWLKDFLEAGKQRLRGDTLREAGQDEVRALRDENARLKQLVGEYALESMASKRSVLGDYSRRILSWELVEGRADAKPCRGNPAGSRGHWCGAGSRADQAGTADRQRQRVHLWGDGRLPAGSWVAAPACQEPSPTDCR